MCQLEQSIAEIYLQTSNHKELVISQKRKHQHKERLCYCCNILQDSKDKIHRLSISSYDRGYGSIFEENNIEIQLCDKCYKEKYKKWFNEQPVIIDGYSENYKHEKDIENLINSFPIENQEYVWNHTLSEEGDMDSQDWIDMKLGILSEEKYKEYNMISPYETKSYQEKFPTCQYPTNIIYEDGSKGCWCPFGAYGEEGQKISENTCQECHNCDFYKQRETPIQTLRDEEFELCKDIIKGKITEEKFNESKIDIHKFSLKRID